MGHGRVRCDEQVQILQHRGGVQERPSVFVQLAPQIRDGKLAFQSRKLLDARVLLDAEQAHPGNARQRLEIIQRDRAVAIAGVLGIALPIDPDLEPWNTGELACQRSNSSGSGWIYGTSAGMASTEVAVSPGTFAQTDSDNETDTDTGSSGNDATIILGAPWTS